jgi:hypothetical protein
VVGTDAADGVEQSGVAMAAHCDREQRCMGLQSSGCGVARGLLG